jgi:hypothetical protein
MFEEETLSAVGITTGAVDLPDISMSEEETLSAVGITTGAVIVDFAAFTEKNILFPVGITTPPPIVPPVVKYGDHIFYMEPLLSGIPYLESPFWNPAFARIVNISTPRIGTKTEVANSNSTKFNNSNNKVVIS